MFNEEQLANTDISRKANYSVTDDSEVISGLRKRVKDLEKELEVSPHVDLYNTIIKYQRHGILNF